MKNRVRPCLWQILFLLAGYWLAGAQCASAGETAKIDKASVRNIEFTLDDDNLDQFGVGLSPSSIAAQIAKNLADADFPVHKAAEKTFSHTLHAHLSRIEHQDTPAGFSFSIGNSDPRAEDFQKADVITIECTLTAKRNPKETAKEAVEFSANALRSMKDKNKIAGTLAEYISGACYELLENLALDEADAPAPDGSVSVKRPRWMPNIRVEIKNEPASPKNSTGESPGNFKNSEETRKKVIIHNQGTPVILKFGHERL
ncbi:hypothetical protein [Candidatus Methylomicrobium oryzae]|jgi:hypothetical protein|uniref:hypothetical protein n=1 Tax=Candidatus Methylomicrobium oryzae TaxID=2802053 RepID=UPI001924E381|nr:hypothetical protein [Methylomicrobium sp. RS1]MBL1263431.1 hypothetical protein [Methylomicrobium sp. RS1]